MNYDICAPRGVANHMLSLQTPVVDEGDLVIYGRATMHGILLASSPLTENQTALVAMAIASAYAPFTNRSGTFQLVMQGAIDEAKEHRIQHFTLPTHA